MRSRSGSDHALWLSGKKPGNLGAFFIPGRYSKHLGKRGKWKNSSRVGLPFLGSFEGRRQIKADLEGRSVALNEKNEMLLSSLGVMEALSNSSTS